MLKKVIYSNSCITIDWYFLRLKLSTAGHYHIWFMQSAVPSCSRNIFDGRISSSLCIARAFLSKVCVFSVTLSVLRNGLFCCWAHAPTRHLLNSYRGPSALDILSICINTRQGNKIQSLIYIAVSVGQQPTTNQWKPTVLNYQSCEMLMMVQWLNEG